jgi:ribosomal protein L40E
LSLEDAVGLESAYIAEIRSKVEGLKQVLNQIEEEFKRKGEQYLTGRYALREGIFFNARKFAYEKNLLFRKRFFDLLDSLYKLFPFIPYEDLREKIEHTDIIDVHQSESNGFAYCFFPGLLHIMATNLMDICEKLGESEILCELQKPLFVGLAYIFNSNKNIFSKEDFEKELKAPILNGAIALALKKGWITETKRKNIYQIKKRPNSIMVTCPYCQTSLSAFERYCHKCGLYLLNMITLRERTNEEDIPSELIYKSEKEFGAYFHFKLISKSFYEYSREELEARKLLMWLMEEVVQKKLTLKIPDYFLYSKYYTKIFVDNLATWDDRYNGYYKVVGYSIEDVQQKLSKICDTMKSKAENEYKRFSKTILEICHGCFEPKLYEHPIFYAKEIFTKVLICPNCGSEMPFYAKYCGHCGFKLKI